jgi:hypothetical protein
VLYRAPAGSRYDNARHCRASARLIAASPDARNGASIGGTAPGLP